VKTSENAYANRLPTPARSHENESRNLKQLATNPKGPGGTGHQLFGMRSQIE